MTSEYWRKMMGWRGFVLRNAMTVKIGGLIFSVVLAVLVEVLGIASRGEAFLVGLVGILVVLLLEAEVRESARRDEERERFDRLLASMAGISKVSQERIAWERFFGEAMGNLGDHHEVLKSPLMAQARDAMVKSERANRLFEGGQIPEIVNSAWERLNSECDDLVLGKARSDLETSLEVMISATRSAERTLLAVTTVPASVGHPEPNPQLSWWLTTGRRYREANVEAAERGVQIFRIIVFEDGIAEDHQREFARHVFSETQPAGMAVGLLSASELPAGRRKNVTVWDMRSAWEGEMNTTGQMIGGTFHEAKVDVAQVLQVFKQAFERLSLATQQNWREHGYRESLEG